MTIEKPKRYMSEKLTSVEDDILLYQQGYINSVSGTAHYLPCSIKEVTGVFLTPMDATANSGTALFTSTVGYAIDAEAGGAVVFSAVSALPDWAHDTSYVVGNIVESHGAAYYCIAAHTSKNEVTVGNEPGEDGDTWEPYWELLNATNFVKVITTAGTVDATYKIEGYGLITQI